MDALNERQIDVLVTRLSELTKKGNVEWRNAADEEYEAELGPFSYTLRSSDGDGVPPIELEVYYNDGEGWSQVQTVYSHPRFSSASMRAVAGISLPVYSSALVDLYESVMRRVSNVDSIVDEMFRSLGTEKPE